MRFRLKADCRLARACMLGSSQEVVIIQDYEDQKKQYHNLEKDYVVHGKPRSIRIPMVNTTEDKSPTCRRMQSTFIRS